jgi:hypothetical protein
MVVPSTGFPAMSVRGGGTPAACLGKQAEVQLIVYAPSERVKGARAGIAGSEFFSQQNLLYHQDFGAVREMPAPLAFAKNVV